MLIRYVPGYRRNTTDQDLFKSILLIPRAVLLVPYFEGLRIWLLFAIGLIFGICHLKTCLVILTNCLSDDSFEHIVTYYQRISIAYSASSQLITKSITVMISSLFLDTLVQVLVSIKAKHLEMQPEIRASLTFAAILMPIAYFSILDQIRSISEESDLFLKKCKKIGIYVHRCSRDSTSKRKWKILLLKVLALKPVQITFLSGIPINRDFVIVVCFNLLLRIVDALLLFDGLMQK